MEFYFNVSNYSPNIWAAAKYVGFILLQNKFIFYKLYREVNKDDWSSFVVIRYFKSNGNIIFLYPKNGKQTSSKVLQEDWLIKIVSRVVFVRENCTQNIFYFFDIALQIIWSFSVNSKNTISIYLLCTYNEFEFTWFKWYKCF